MTLKQSEWTSGLLRTPKTPFQLVFLPGLFLVWKDTPDHVKHFFYLLLIPVCVFYTCWFYSYQNIRYLLPVLSLLLILSAYAYSQMIDYRLLRWVANCFLLFSLLFFFAYNLLFTLPTAPVVFGLESKESYLSRKIGFYNDISWMNHNLPENSRVLFFHLKPFYLKRDYIFGTRTVWKINKDTTDEDYLSQLINKNITHIFIPGEIRQASETTKTYQLISQLKEKHKLASIYYNPSATRVTSRTLSKSTREPVEIFKVVYP